MRYTKQFTVAVPIYESYIDEGRSRQRCVGELTIDGVGYLMDDDTLEVDYDINTASYREIGGQTQALPLTLFNAIYPLKEDSHIHRSVSAHVEKLFGGQDETPSLLPMFGALVNHNRISA